MLRLIAIVRPQRADIVCQRLLASGLVEDLTAVECRGYGRQKGHLENYKDSEYVIDFLPKVQIQAVIEESAQEKVTDMILSTCRTGRIGDGKVFLQKIVPFVPVG